MDDEEFKETCECDCGNAVQVEWIDFYDRNIRYLLCMNCVFHFVNHSLTPEQFLALIKNGHGDTEFMLHDFYDEEGNALQPTRILVNPPRRIRKSKSKSKLGWRY